MAKTLEERGYLTTFRTSLTQKMVTTSLTHSFETMFLRCRDPHKGTRSGSASAEVVASFYRSQCYRPEQQMPGENLTH